MRITRYACVLHGMAWVRLDKDAPFGVSWVAATDGEWVRYEEAMRAATAALAADVAKAGLARVAELEAHLENAREDWRTAYARLEKEDARVAELETEVMRLTRQRTVFVAALEREEVENTDNEMLVFELKTALQTLMSVFGADSTPMVPIMHVNTALALARAALAAVGAKETRTMADRPKVLLNPVCVRCGYPIHGPHSWLMGAPEGGPFCPKCAAEYPPPAVAGGGGGSGGYVPWVAGGGGGKLGARPPGERRIEALEARVTELETDPRMALTADDLRWAAHEANQTAKWLCAYPARHADDATTALARAERFGTANRAALAAEKGDEV